MLDPHAISPSPDWHYIAGGAADADGIKLSFASPTAVTEYTGGQLDGVIGVLPIRPTMLIEIATSAQPGAYNIVDPFVITGLDYAGNEITENIKLLTTGGADTVTGLKPFAKVTKVKSPAHPLGTGAITIGVGDWAFSPPARKLKSRVAGAIPVYTSTGVLEALTLAVGDELNLVIPRIAKSAAAFPFIVFR